ncbi:MAG: DUF177 domain-containing protein [Desulfobulbaceae bacterium]|nr:DUF177 domain-containing protein [Desulfobulbaceae bacterium]HIJ79626.1 DUF177 domain-containing protein [Deltaproteobacteria bacterium]
MRLRFDEIPKGGLRLNIVDNAWLPSDEFKCHLPATAEVFLDRNGNRVFCEGSLQVKVELFCDRCLDDFIFPIDTGFKFDLELIEQDDQRHFAKDHACTDAEMDVIFLDEPVVDIFSILAQQVYLAIPDKRLCRKKCLGLCPECGVNLNREHCECGKDLSSSPFGVLAKLKQQ